MKQSKSYTTIIELLGFLFAAWACVRLGMHVAQYLSFPLPLDDGEGHVLNQAINIASGKLPYHSISEPPYIVTNYPPLFPSLAAVFFPFLKDIDFFSSVTVFPGLLVTRALSVISGLGIAILIYLISLRNISNRNAAAIAVILFLAMPIVYFWFAIGKPDMLAIFLGLLGLYVGIVNLEKGAKIYLSLIPLVLAVFTKQNEIAPFLAIAIFLLIKKDNRLLYFVLIYLISIAMATIALQIATSGEFLKHIIIYTRTKFYFQRLWTTWGFFFQHCSLVLVISFILLIRSFISKKISPVYLYFLFSFLISLTAGKVGSDMNYFLETTIAAHILLAIYLADGFRIISKPSLRLVTAGLVFLIALDFSFIHDERYLSYQPTNEDYQTGSLIIDTIKRMPGPVLSEDEALSAIAGKEVYFNPFIMSELSKEGLWDQTPFVDSIKNKFFDLIILRFDVNNPNNEDQARAGDYAGWDRWTPEMETAIRENYRNYASIPMRRQWYFYYPLRPEIIEQFRKN